MQSTKDVSIQPFFSDIEKFLNSINIKTLNQNDKKILNEYKNKLVGKYLNIDQYLKTIGFNSEQQLKDYWNEKTKQ